MRYLSLRFKPSSIGAFFHWSSNILCLGWFTSVIGKKVGFFPLLLIRTNFVLTKRDIFNNSFLSKPFRVLVMAVFGGSSQFTAIAMAHCLGFGIGSVSDLQSQQNSQHTLRLGDFYIFDISTWAMKLFVWLLHTRSLPFMRVSNYRHA